MIQANSYDILPFRKYLQITDIDYQTELSYSIEILSILMDKTPSEIRDLPYYDYASLMEDLQYLQFAPEVREGIETVSFEGEIYLVDDDITTFSVSRFADIEFILTNFEEDELYKSLVALILKEQNETVYDPILRLMKKEWILDLDTTTVYSLFHSFLKKKQIFQRIIHRFGSFKVITQILSNREQISTEEWNNLMLHTRLFFN